jgi:glycosyltransferase involved in cell wall biosynthesis
VRILHAADFGNAAPGGFVPLLAALARRLAERGDAFALAVPAVDGAGWHGTLRDAGVELHVVSGGADAARFAHAWRPDLAHVHFFGWELALTRALWATRARLVWHVHSTSRRDGQVRRTPKTIAKYRGAGARVERFAAVTQAVGEELATLGAPRTRIAVVRNAVDPEVYRAPSAAERAAARAALGIDGPAILFFGRDPVLKGADTLSAALALLPRCTVVTVATPADTNAELGRAARLVAVDRTDDVRALMWASDVLAVPSRGEGASLVLLEALACGAPVVASDLPALRESGAGAEGIRFAPPGNAVALARQLAAALAAPRPEPQRQPRTPQQWADEVLALYEAPA